jgi:hypothetical protein
MLRNPTEIWIKTVFFFLQKQVVPAIKKKAITLNENGTKWCSRVNKPVGQMQHYHEMRLYC